MGHGRPMGALAQCTPHASRELREAVPSALTGSLAPARHVLAQAAPGHLPLESIGDEVERVLALRRRAQAVPSAGEHQAELRQALARKLTPSARSSRSIVS